MGGYETIPFVVLTPDRLKDEHAILSRLLLYRVPVL